MGFVDYENLYGIEGVGLANVVANAAEVESKKVSKLLRSRITFDDGEFPSSLYCLISPFPCNNQRCLQVGRGLGFVPLLKIVKGEGLAVTL